MFYLDLFKCLAKHRVQYLLVGGIAMNLHGVPRMTMDVDIIIVLDDDNVSSFVSCAKELGLKPAVPVDLEDILSPDLRRAWIREKNMVAFPMVPADPKGPTIDILIDPPIDIEAALSRAEHRTLGDVSIPLASIEDMIELKAHAGRMQDLADVEHLIRIKRRKSGGRGTLGEP